MAIVTHLDVYKWAGLWVVEVRLRGEVIAHTSFYTWQEALEWGLTCLRYL